jgi:hypothetical protein
MFRLTRKAAALARVLPTETVVCDGEIQHQRHRARRVGKLGLQFNIPTMSTPAFSYVLCLDL